MYGREGADHGIEVRAQRFLWSVSGENGMAARIDLAAGGTTPSKVRERAAWR